MINTFEIADYTVYVSQYDRVASGGSKGNQIKWYKDGVWYKADFLGCEGLSEYICSCLLRASNVRGFVEYAPAYIKETDSGMDYFGCQSRDFGTIITADVLLLQLPEKYNVWLNPTKSPATDLHVFCQGVADVFGADILEDMKVMLQFDMIVGNEDRIMRNFGLRKKGNHYGFSPLFDNGLSLLSDFTSPNRVASIDEIRYHPFGFLREKGNGLKELGITPIIIDMDKLAKETKNVPLYSRDSVNNTLHILRQSLDETEGRLWARLR